MPVVHITAPAIYDIHYLGRPLTCTRCHQTVDAIHIDLTGSGDHNWIPANEFTCGQCLQPTRDPADTLRDLLAATRSAA